MNLVLLYCLVVSFLVAADENKCGPIGIEDWGGSPSAITEVLKVPVDLVVVTHTVTSGCTTDEECQRILNAIRRNQKKQGFQDIGLSFLIGENGKVYEGSGWRVGRHTKGFNDQSISLSFIGDYRTRVPNQAALSAAQNFLTCTLGWAVTKDYRLVGHRQLIATISPGDALQRIIETWPNWVQHVGTRPH